MRRAVSLAVLAVALAAGPAAADPAPEYNYLLRCVGCHTQQGVSPPLGRIPPLKDVVGHFARLPEGRRYIVNVPGIVGAQLLPGETAALLNWMMTTYGGASLPKDFRSFSAEEILALRRNPPGDITRLRALVRQRLAEHGYPIDPYP